jgi:hypothetical protein
VRHAAVTEQLALRIRALDNTVGEAHEQITGLQLQRTAADLDGDVAISEWVATGSDDACRLEDARLAELHHVRKVLPSVRIVEHAVGRVEHRGERGHQHVVIADHADRLVDRAQDLIGRE